MYVLHSSAALSRSARLVSVIFALLTVTLAAPASTPETLNAPPAFSDSAHVMNGCFISSTAYLAKFRAEFPGEQGHTLTVTPKNYEMTHTVAVVSWLGRWYIRDEYFGVVAMNALVKDDYNEVQLQRKASSALEAFSAKAVRDGEADASVMRRQLKSSERPNEIATAASLLPVATEPFSVESEGKSYLFLYFQPAPGVVAVYNPLVGTVSAKCTGQAHNAAGVVAAVARLLGHKPDAVHATTLVSSAVAAASATRVASLR